jgi:hypothetical protein
MHIKSLFILNNSLKKKINKTIFIILSKTTNVCRFFEVIPPKLWKLADSVFRTTQFFSSETFSIDLLMKILKSVEK